MPVKKFEANNSKMEDRINHRLEQETWLG